MQQKTKYVKLFEEFKQEYNKPLNEGKLFEDFKQEYNKPLNEGKISDFFSNLISKASNALKKIFTTKVTTGLKAGAVNHCPVFLIGDETIARQLDTFYKSTSFGTTGRLPKVVYDEMQPEHRAKTGIAEIVKNRNKINESKKIGAKIGLEHPTEDGGDGIVNVNAAYIVECIKDQYFQQVDNGRRRLPPPLILGAPGIGKTQIVAQAADELGLAMMCPDVSLLAKEDFVGLPVPVVETEAAIVNGEWIKPKGKTVNYPSELLPLSFTNNGINLAPQGGIIFLDEFTSAENYLLESIKNLIQQGRVNDYYIPTNWIIVCAGNRISDSTEVTDVSELSAVMSRLEVVNFVPNPQDWFDWAEAEAELYNKSGGKQGTLILPEFRQFVKEYPEFFYNLKDNTKGGFAAPRSWDDLSAKLIAGAKRRGLSDWKDLDRETLKNKIATTVGKEATDYLMLYLDVFKDISPRDIELIQTQPEKAKLLKGIDQGQIMVVYGLIDYLIKTIEKIPDRLDRMNRLKNTIIYLFRYKTHEPVSAGLNKFIARFDELNKTQATAINSLTEEETKVLDEIIDIVITTGDAKMKALMDGLKKG